MIALLFSQDAVAAWVGAGFVISRAFAKVRKHLRKHVLLLLWAVALIVIRATVPWDAAAVDHYQFSVGECAGGSVAWIQAGRPPFA